MMNSKIKVFKKPIPLGKVKVIIKEEETEGFLYHADFSKGYANIRFPLGYGNCPEEIPVKKMFKSTLKEKLQYSIWEIDRIIDEINEIDGDSLDDDLDDSIRYLLDFEEKIEPLIDYLEEHEEKIHPGQLSIEDYQDE